MSAADEETVNGTDYAVGFRRPPLHTRFKPGVSGNPSGRPKDCKNFKTLLHSILNEQISLQEGMSFGNVATSMMPWSISHWISLPFETARSA
jgi:hypothetical protein